MANIKEMTQFLLENGEISLVGEDFNVSCWKDDDKFYKTDDGEIFSFGKEERVIQHLVKEIGGIDNVLNYQ